MNHALQNEDVELWHVEVAPNDVRVLTLEQLDEAFQQGLVNERTRVFQDGMDEPAFLGELLGLGDDDEEEEAQEQPVAAAPPPRAPEPKRIHQQTLVGLSAEPPRSAPQPRGMPPGPPAYAQQSGVRPVHGGPPPMASQRPQGPYANPGYPQSAPPAAQPRRAAAAEGAWPPVVSRSPAQPSSMPPPSTPSTITGVVAPSVVPMAMDLGASDDFEYPQRKGKGKIVLAGVGVLAIAAGAALAVTGQGAQLLGSLTASAAAPAPVKPKPVVDTKSHAYDPGSAPVKLKEDAPAPVVITTRENEAEQLKAAGMTADTAAKAATPNASDDKSSPLAKPSKKGAAISSKRAKSSGGGAPHHGGGGGGAPKGPFHAGGDTHDPLNGSL
jgi:hypothetical protein